MLIQKAKSNVNPQNPQPVKPEFTTLGEATRGVLEKLARRVEQKGAKSDD